MGVGRPAGRGAPATGVSAGEGGASAAGADELSRSFGAEAGTAAIGAGADTETGGGGTLAGVIPA